MLDSAKTSASSSSLRLGSRKPRISSALAASPPRRPFSRSLRRRPRMLGVSEVQGSSKPRAASNQRRASLILTLSNGAVPGPHKFVFFSASRGSVSPSCRPRREHGTRISSTGAQGLPWRQHETMSSETPNSGATLATAEIMSSPRLPQGCRPMSKSPFRSCPIRSPASRTLHTEKWTSDSPTLSAHRCATDTLLASSSRPRHGRPKRERNSRVRAPRPAPMSTTRRMSSTSNQDRTASTQLVTCLAFCSLMPKALTCCDAGSSGGGGRICASMLSSAKMNSRREFGGTGPATLSVPVTCSCRRRARRPCTSAWANSSSLRPRRNAAQS
mmetsp:Transcript_16547/g.47204  ORF Transcript_16547/g.47204 Transcript_16547/m.47204 type:complete len:329 (-) Transcript_16547:2-988(-)